ncbi:hypothetical protein [uncultured Pseudoteredinibacter sp.]|uniref:hypothetical protein n=1 Tax=uncultured Pseudoteredinibacter sp. TaxID=1641701 RepID=UPI002608F185|nr:hypothetical protein [uncultured Pseudoteredinibacter sp.]
MFYTTRTVYILLLSLVLTSFAQSQDSQKAEGNLQKQEKQSTKIEKQAVKNKDKTSKAARDAKNEQVFKPTEEISEDLPVAFPVDI